MILKIAAVCVTTSVFALQTLSAADEAKAGAGKKGHGTPEERFKKWDENGDGKLSLAEYVGKKTAAEDEEEFKKFDKDGDGFLTLEEFLAGMSKQKKKK
jgi:hypothetical protein